MLTIFFIRFSLMKDISRYTRPNPNVRTETLLDFNKRLQIDKSVANFNEWNFELSKDLVKVSGRCLENQRIIFGQNTQ